MPQIIQFHSPPEHVAACIEQATVLLDAHELTADERVALYPHVFGALLDKPIGMQPDGPTLDLNALKLGRH